MPVSRVGAFRTGSPAVPVNLLQAWTPKEFPEHYDRPEHLQAQIDEEHNETECDCSYEQEPEPTCDARAPESKPENNCNTQSKDPGCRVSRRRQTFRSPDYAVGMMVFGHYVAVCAEDEEGQADLTCPLLGLTCIATRTEEQPLFPHSGSSAVKALDCGSSSSAASELHLRDGVKGYHIQATVRSRLRGMRTFISNPVHPLCNEDLGVLMVPDRSTRRGSLGCCDVVLVSQGWRRRASLWQSY